jgi:hypothetical protein
MIKYSNNPVATFILCVFIVICLVTCIYKYVTGFKRQIYLVTFIYKHATDFQTSDLFSDVVRTKNEQANGPALRPDGPRSGRSAHVGRTVRACAEQIRVPSFVLRLLAKIMG